MPGVESPMATVSTRWPLVATKTVKLNPGKISCAMAAARVVLSDNMKRLH